MSRSQGSPSTLPIRPTSKKLARVGIFRNGELSHVSIVPDPRGSFCDTFNAEWSPSGLTARVVADDVEAAEVFDESALVCGGVEAL